MFPLYLQYLLIDFRQTFVTGASWDTDDLITFLGHTITAEAHSTRRYCRVQLFLVLTFIRLVTVSLRLSQFLSVWQSLYVCCVGMPYDTLSVVSLWNCGLTYLWTD